MRERRSRISQALHPGYNYTCPGLEPGPFQTAECGTIPGQQRTTKKCCAAPGTQARADGAS